MASSKTTIEEVEKRNLLLACLLAEACDQRRADDVQVLDLRAVCDFADAFVIATATSTPQLRGLTKEAERIMAGERVKLISKAGLGPSGWVVLDFGDVVAHLMTEEHRQFYDLEQMWGDGTLLNWSEVVKEAAT